MNSTKLCFSKLISELDQEILKTDTTLYMLPVNTNDNITSIINNSFENVVKQLIKNIKHLQGTYKRIVNLGQRELNNFYTNNNITELSHTKALTLEYNNEYILNVKPHFISKDKFNLQPYNYNELLHYYISDDLTIYNKYLIVFTITKVKKPIIKTRKILSKSEYCKTKLNTEEPKKLQYYINKFLKSDNRTELLLTYNKLNSMTSELLLEIITEENSDLICKHVNDYHDVDNELHIVSFKLSTRISFVFTKSCKEEKKKEKNKLLQKYLNIPMKN